MVTGGATYNFVIPAGTVVKGNTPVTFNLAKKVAPSAYMVEIKTANVRGAGTDAKVEVKLNGESGSSDFVELDAEGDDREKGRTDEYVVSCRNLGDIKCKSISIVLLDKSMWFYVI